MQVSSKSPNMEQLGGSKRRMGISPAIAHSRGARFLDLVKQNKLNVSPQLTKRLSANKAFIKDLMEKKDERKEEYLKFSNILPNPNSSPSSGILSKRKAMEQDSSETPDSPMGNSAKRKRVSFNDPVSTTKEYLITEEEERHKSNSLIRCLVYDEGAENGEDGSESIENKENIKIEQKEEGKEEEEFAVVLEKVRGQGANGEVNIEEDGAKPLAIKEEHLEVLPMDHDYFDKDENPQNTDVTTSSIEDSPEQPLSAEEEEEDEEMLEEGSNNERLSFKNKSELIDYITREVSIEELLEAKRKEFIGKVLQTMGPNEMLDHLLPLPDSKHTPMPAEQIETTSNVINHISKLMKINDRVKHKVLDALSESHSKDFLTHALQENSTSQVCEKLTMPNIINYIIHKVNVCDDSDEASFEVNRMNRSIMHHLVKKTSDTREIIADQKETQELLKLLFKNKQKIDVLDTVHEFLRSNIIHGQF